ncbi:hypothetical protein CELL_03381 [Cellulomonas sp. T2.31MG-18]
MSGRGGDLRRLDEFCARLVRLATDGDFTDIEGALTFPRGMCTWISYAGGEILRERGFGTWTIQNATTPARSPRHDWLVRDDLFVDLTAHQFKDAGYETFIVGRGQSPLVSRFPVHVGGFATSGIVGRA